MRTLLLFFPLLLCGPTVPPAGSGATSAFPLRMNPSPPAMAGALVAPTPQQAQALAALDRDMVRIAGGSFTMGCTAEQGSDCDANEKPAHKVELSSFWLSKYEVTQELWQAVMGNNPSYFEGCARCPVEKVSWDDAQGFIRKVNELTGQRYRLPTEAEWEYAARGGQQSRGTMYAGGKVLENLGWYKANSRGEIDPVLLGYMTWEEVNRGETHPVGKKAPNELGLYDMTGNVWEWCRDWYSEDYYSRSILRDPPGAASGDGRVLRGGSWHDSPRYSRLAVRLKGPPDVRYSHLGFRLARTE